MKKHFLLFLLCLATNASLTAQETLRENNGEPTLVERLSNGEIKINSAEMNFQLFTSANAEFVGNELDGMNFKLNRVRLEIKGGCRQVAGVSLPAVVQQILRSLFARQPLLLARAGLREPKGTA